MKNTPFTIQFSEDYAEIRHERFGASITVHRPRKQYGGTVKPAYMNCSTFTSDGNVPVNDWFQMQFAAAELLNKFNETLSEVASVEEPLRWLTRKNTLERQWDDYELVARRVKELRAREKKGAV